MIFNHYNTNYSFLQVYRPRFSMKMNLKYTKKPYLYIHKPNNPGFAPKNIAYAKGCGLKKDFN